MMRNLRSLLYFRRKCPLLHKNEQPLHFNNSFRRSNSTTVYDPPYLDLLKPPVPLYEPLNFEISGPDYALVESFQRVVHRLASSMELDVADCWAVPPRKTRIVKYKPGGTVCDTEYNLSYYVRYVQVVDMPNNMAPILIELAQAALPQSVTLNVRLHTEQDDKERYVPDHELELLKSELIAAGGPSKSKK